MANPQRSTPSPCPILPKNSPFHSFLLSLPQEIFLEIFSQTDFASQINLALAYPQLQGIFASLSVKSPDLPATLFNHPPDTIKKYIELMQPRDKAGTPDMTWNVCRSCLKFKPAKKSFWKQKLSTKLFKEVWDLLEFNWDRNLNCPECFIRQRTESEESNFYAHDYM